MPALALPEVIESFETEPSISDSGGTGRGGGLDHPHYDPFDNSPFETGWSTPLSAYRLITCLAIVWIAVLFATLTLVLESRWVHSKDWIPISLPHMLYVNTGILLLSSLTMEFSRASSGGKANRRSKYLLLTLFLAIAFAGGQALACRELSSQGIHFASNPGSFFFYLFTGLHGIHLLAAIVALACVGLFTPGAARQVRCQMALNTVALYWHFIDGVWLYILTLLVVTLQRR